MQYSKVIPLLLFVSLFLQGCYATVYVKPPADSPDASISVTEVEGEIMKNEGGILYVDDGNHVLEIPTESVQDIDHPVAAVITGAVFTAAGLGMIAWLAWGTKGGFFNEVAFGLPGVSLMLAGIPIGIGGLIAYSHSKSAAQPRIATGGSIEELSVAPTPFTMPSARGLSLTVSF